VIALLPCLLAAAPLQALPSEQIDSALWVTDAPINALGYAEGTLYAGGPFGWVGPPTGAFSTLDPIAGARDEVSVLPRVSGIVYAVEPDGQGGWFVAGDFSRVETSECRYLAHFLADGTLDDWCADVLAPVHGLARRGDVLYLGGQFGSVGGQIRNRVAAVTVDDGQLLPWDPAVAASMTSSELIWDLEVDGSVVYLAGDFDDTLIGGKGRRYAAAVDADTGLALPFHPAADDAVLELHVADGAVYLGGQFMHLGLTARSHFAEVSPATGAPTALDPSPDSTVWCFEREGDTLYFGGNFSSVAGSPRAHLAAVSVTSGALLPFAPVIDGGDGTGTKVLDLAVEGGTLWAVGSFTSVAGSERAHAAAFDLVSESVLPWAADVAGPFSTEAWCIQPANGELAIGGDFTMIGGVQRDGLVAIDTATGKPTGWAPSVASTLAPWTVGDVARIEIDGDRVFLSGSFQYVDGVLRHDVAAVDRATGALLAEFEFGATDLQGHVTACLPHDGLLTIAGKLAPQPLTLSRADAATGRTVPGFEAAPNSVADDLVKRPGLEPLYLAGKFVEIVDGDGIHLRRRLAALDSASGAVLPWDPDANDDVSDLEPVGDTVFAAGSFTAVGGVVRPRVAALDADSGAVLPWNIDLAGPASWSVDRLLEHLGVLYVAGGFWALDGLPYSGLAAVDIQSGSGFAWDARISTRPAALAVGQGKLFAAGSFDVAGGRPVWNLAAYPLELLSTDGGEISVSSGGAQTLTIATWPELAGRAYWIAGSLSGSEPGFHLLGHHVPLNPDAYTALTLGPGLGVMSGATGVLDASGSAQAALALPAGAPPGFAGLVLHHAAAVFDPATLALDLVTNATRLELVP